MLSSLKAGTNSNGNASSIQYLLMIGATFVSMKPRICLKNASSSAFKVSASS